MCVCVFRTVRSCVSEFGRVPRVRTCSVRARAPAVTFNVDLQPIHDVTGKDISIFPHPPLKHQ